MAEVINSDVQLCAECGRRVAQYVYLNRATGKTSFLCNVCEYRHIDENGEIAEGEKMPSDLERVYDKIDDIGDRFDMKMDRFEDRQLQMATQITAIGGTLNTVKENLDSHLNNHKIEKKWWKDVKGKVVAGLLLAAILFAIGAAWYRVTQDLALAAAKEAM